MKVGCTAFDGCSVFGIVSLVCGAALASGSSEVSTADRLVADALRAEASGDADRRAMLLDQAVAVSPDNQLARWHRGEIESDGQWQSVEELQQAAAADPRRAEYHRRRAAAGDSPDAQLALARWCRKNNLDDEAWFHWANVVSQQPGNDEALRALGMRWYQNRLLTHDQIDVAKERFRESRRAAKRWAPQITKWKRDIAGDLPERERALAEIRALDDSDAISALEELTLEADVSSDLDLVRCRQISRAFIRALSAMPAQQATESLIRHALFSPVPLARDAAIDALRQRPLHDYVPMLLDELAMPIESSFRVATDGEGSVHYWHSLYREGRDADQSMEARSSAMQHDLQGPTDLTVINGDDRTEVRVPAPTDPTLMAKMAAVAAENTRRYGGAAVGVQQRVYDANRAIEQSNARIIPLLVATTDQELGDNPRDWWNWWNEYTGYETDGEQPVYERRYAEQSHRYYRGPRQGTYDITPPPPPPPGGSRRCECFVAGTLVWTKSGRQAIETLQIGDLVLAQDVDTGELAYKTVMGRTVRPPSEVVSLTIHGEEVRSTVGHLFWAAGNGWRMAKELGEDAVLHGLDGPLRVEAIEPAGEAEAYNLIVADFNTYFVGDSGILVHDNTAREPTVATVPGLVGK